jgi:hypothetical protein
MQNDWTISSNCHTVSQTPGRQHPDRRDCFLIRHRLARSTFAPRAHGRVGRQFGWARDARLHMFPKIVLYIPNSEKHQDDSKENIKLVSYSFS